MIRSSDFVGAVHYEMHQVGVQNSWILLAKKKQMAIAISGLRAKMAAPEPGSTEK